MDKVFINLPSSDLVASRRFYTGIGATINEMFSNDDAICVVISDSIYFMILKPAFYEQFNKGKKTIIDPSTHLQVMNALSATSREHVDDLFTKALENGGKEFSPVQDLGFMYSHAVEDNAGNVLEFFFMEVPE